MEICEYHDNMNKHGKCCWEVKGDKKEGEDKPQAIEITTVKQILDQIFVLNIKLEEGGLIGFKKETKVQYVFKQPGQHTVKELTDHHRAKTLLRKRN
jgi:hypothetical protein